MAKVICEGYFDSEALSRDQYVDYMDL